MTECFEVAENLPPLPRGATLDDARRVVRELMPGEQGLESVEYREPDESSREWVEARRLEAVADDLSGDYDARFDREKRRVVVAAGELDDDEAEDAVNALEDRLGDDYIVTWSRDDDGDVRLYVSVA